MNHGALRHLWTRPRGPATTVASTTARCLSSSTPSWAKYFDPQLVLANAQKIQKKQQHMQKQDGDGLQSLEGPINLGLADWARKNGIDLHASKQFKPCRSKEGSKDTGVYVHYSTARHPSEYHMKDLVLTTTRTVKLRADYERMTKNPLWLVQYASFNDSNIVRTTAMKKARGALLAALKRNHYLPNGKAFADPLVRGTELYGTIKIFVNEPVKTVNTPLAKIATQFNALLNRVILDALRRPVIKKPRPVSGRPSPAADPFRRMLKPKPVSWDSDWI
ncbi:hypothetical protein QBC39DRAFT_1157 [Podospora conica]|nr:hypothetical protein QBC39DRAFT_1157 [Schizothecium conicum]